MVLLLTKSSVHLSYAFQRDAEPNRTWHTKRHKGSCRGIEFSPNGRLLVTVGKDGGVKIADSTNGQVCRKDMEAHT